MTPLDALLAGEVVVVPTDTVYGLACLPRFPGAVARIFSLKGRPDGKALPVLGASAQALSGVAAFNDDAVNLAHRFWPGPLTLVLPRAEGFTYFLGEDPTGSVAVRVPRNEVVLELLAAAGPLAVTSANLSGHPPADTVEDAHDVFGADVAAYVDGGRGAGVPSTVVSLRDGMEVLREGAVTRDELTEALR